MESANRCGALRTAEFLTGMGSFVSDLILPRQCYGAPVLSPHAHARIVRVEVSAALSAPGVLAVLTGADVESDGLGGIPPYFLVIRGDWDWDWDWDWQLPAIESHQARSTVVGK